jgi:hypothetical protein
MPSRFSAAPTTIWSALMVIVKKAKIEAEQHAARDPGQQAKRDTAGGEGCREAAEGADEHGAFQADIEHARSLGKYLADGGEDEGGRKPPGGARQASRER